MKIEAAKRRKTGKEKADEENHATLENEHLVSDYRFGDYARLNQNSSFPTSIYDGNLILNFCL